MKNHGRNDTEKVKELINKIENMAGLPAFDFDTHEDVKVNIRVNESVGPAKFKSDPLIPGGFIANSLTIRAMKSDLFVMGNSFEDLFEHHSCACGEAFDLQFWKICPYCGRDT